MISSVVVSSLLGILSLAAAPAWADVPAPGVYLNSNGSPLFPLLESATQSVDIEIYTMNDMAVHADIRAAMARGVRFRILKDPNPLEDPCNTFLPLGQSGRPSDDSANCQDQRQLVADVRNAGGSFEPFDKATLCPNGGKSGYGGSSAGTGCFEHGKIAIVDGTTALISTGNFDDTSLCLASENPSRCNRDYTVVENDSTIVSTLENIFNTDLQAQSYDVRTLIPSSLTDVLTVSPYSLPPLLDLINSAQTSIDVETQYLKDSEMNQALMDAAHRGVHVNVTVASICAFGTPSASEAKAATTTYSDFDRAGISTAMFNNSNTINGKPGYLHAKTIIVDGNRAWVGSENGSTESLTENREYGVIFTDSEWVSGVLGIVTADHNSPDSETWNDSLGCAKDRGGDSVSSSGSSDGNTGSSRPTPEPTHKHPKKPSDPSSGTIFPGNDDGDSNPIVAPSQPSTPDPTPTHRRKRKEDGTNSKDSGSKEPTHDGKKKKTYDGDGNDTSIDVSDDSDSSSASGDQN
jgi:phosphatidylserine/phosphatidylglycerophosphate/cardiolipin synthase-like enzyme